MIPSSSNSAGRSGASDSGSPDIAAYHELQCYSLAHGGSEFIHQHVVDAWAAQHADAQTKPIAVTFALVGLYLHVEKGFSGRQVQRAHMALARHKEDWPTFALPPERGAITVGHVMASQTGPMRDRAIEAWCESVWCAFSQSRDAVAALLNRRGIVGTGGRP